MQLTQLIPGTRMWDTVLRPSLDLCQGYSNCQQKRWEGGFRQHNSSVQFSSVQLLSRVWLFVTPWTAAHQASLSITSSWSLPKLMSIELRMPSNHLILPPSIFLASVPFQRSQFFASGGQSVGVSASASVLPMYIQGWFPLGLTGVISLLSKGPSRIFSNTAVQKHQFFGTQPSLRSNSQPNLWSIRDYWKNHSFD